MESIPEAIRENSTIYEVSLEGTGPKTTFRRLQQDLANFRIAYQEVIGTILKEHGLIESLDLFPGVPSPVAVLCGRELLPKVHSRLRMYDYNKISGGFTLALEV